MKIKKLIVGAIQTNCYILISGNEIGLIDPGEEAERILFEINKYNSKLKFIINTHYHSDHVLANQVIKGATGAKILIHENERDFLEGFIPDQYLSDGDFIEIGDVKLRVILTPGHTKGSVCLLDLKERFIFTGDTLFLDGYGRIDLPGGDELQMDHSLQMLKKLIKPGMEVYPGHGETFTCNS